MGGVSMTDLISRSAVLDILSNEFDMASEERAEADNEKDRTFNAGEINCARRSTRKVKELAAVDAVPVVRCKSCMKRRTFECPMYSETDGSDYGLDIIINDRTDDDGYCHCGARMDGEADV